ncbi:MAG: UbiX family flavin prenyltransferase [Deltaproteobacteria bacterium]|nr:UbiX family flavin prenyltransferase [Deltaproteobacteria bacterium]
MKKRRIVVGISGATGVIYGVRLLEVLARTNVETHLVLTHPGRRNIELETDWKVADVERLASCVHDVENIAASIASGSFLTEGMAVVPCSMKTLSGIVHSYNENLLNRAADVALKERRRLVLLPRETPLHKGHLELMLKAADLGAMILPPMVAWYHRPTTVQEIIDQTVGKVLDAFGVEHHLYRRWEGAEPSPPPPKPALRVARA